MNISELLNHCEKLKDQYKDKLSDEALDEIVEIAIGDFCLFCWVPRDEFCLYGIHKFVEDFSMRKRMYMYELYSKILDFLYEEHFKALKPVIDKYKGNYPEVFLLTLRDISIFDYYAHHKDNKTVKNAIELVDLICNRFLGVFDERYICVSDVKKYFEIYSEMIAILKPDDDEDEDEYEEGYYA